MIFFSIKNLKEKYKNKYLKNKKDFFKVLKSSGKRSLVIKYISLCKAENIINKKNKKNNLSKKVILIFTISLPNINNEETIIKKTFKLITRLPAIKLTGIKAMRRVK